MPPATRFMRCEEVPEDAPSIPHLPVVVWLHDGPVCVRIVDAPPREPQTVCRCGGCHASDRGELAEKFLP